MDPDSGRRPLGTRSPTVLQIVLDPGVVLPLLGAALLGSGSLLAGPPAALRRLRNRRS
jgi:hypothetical protein